MYSERYRFIYIRIPKTASKSMVETLSKLTKGEVCRKQALRITANHPIRPSHDHPVLHNYAAALTEPIDQYFIFTFVRNPWERMVSGYFYSRGLRRRLAHQMSFREFCHSHSQRYQYNNSLWHTQPIPYDFVGRVETLQADFNRLCDRLGLGRMTLPHRNTSRHGDYRQYYDDETRELVTRKYARDIETFDYKF